MTTITITGKKPGKTDVTISSTVNPAVKTDVPVTVLSRNLLSYGPAEGNGLTSTVNTDGSLHVTGAAARQWAGLGWTFPCPVQGTVILRAPTFISGLSPSVKFLDAKGHQLDGQVTSGAMPLQSLPAPSACASKSCPARPRPPRRTATSESSSNPATPRTSGCDPTTRALGGGCELANLYPRVTGLPKTVGAAPGITVTAPTPGTYRFKGSTTTGAGSWNNLTSVVHVDAGTYTMDATDWPLGNNSWLMGIQAHISHDDGSEGANVFGPTNYGPKTLKAGTLQCNIFVNTTGEVDKTFTPRLYKID